MFYIKTHKFIYFVPTAWQFQVYMVMRELKKNYNNLQ